MWIWGNVEDQLDAESYKSRTAGHSARGENHDQQYSPAKAQVDWACDGLQNRGWNEMEERRGRK